MTAVLRRHGDWLLLGAVVLAVCVLHVVAFGNRHIADDAWFASALDSRDILDFLAWRYRDWSGRIPIEAAVVLLVSHPWWWKLGNALAWLLFCFAAGRVSLGRTGMPASRSTVIAFGLLMLMSPGVLYPAAWWMTGSVNYLWPVALGLFGLMAWTGRDERGFLARAAFLLASGLAMYNEQVAIALLPAAAILVGLRARQRRLQGWDVAQFAFMAANALVVFMAPGSRRRFLSEQALRFPDFATLDAMDKATIGIGLVLDGLVDSANWLLAAVIVMAGALVLRSPARTGTRLVLLGMLSFLALGYLVAVPGFPGADGLQSLHAVPPLDGATANSSRAYALAAWSCFAVACLLAACVAALWRSRREALIAALALSLGLGSLLAIGFSPTAYASGPRVQFVCQVGFLLVAARLVEEVRGRFGARASALVLACLAGAAAYRVSGLLP